MQHTSQLLMIRPANFGYNAETAVNNRFQQKSDNASVHSQALIEFDRLVEALQKKQLQVTVINDTQETYTPDAVFPNNWISFHENGTVYLYPMFALNRRLERKTTILDQLTQKFIIGKIVDLSVYEKDQQFLEGTGSMVLDRENHFAYACLSPRTNEEVFNNFCRDAGYTPVPFHALDQNGEAIYHTNVMMCVADEFAVICLDSIVSATEKKTVIQNLESCGKQIIPISFQQMNRFAGNMLQVHNVAGEKFLVMSTSAFQSLTAEQIACIENFQPIIHADIQTIETNGGGSARCMIAEIFLQMAK